MSDICFFAPSDAALSVSEFGYSAPSAERTVGPWVRGTFLLHVVLDGVCHFDGFDASPGDAFLIAKDVRHSFSIQPGYRHFWLGFDGGGAGALLSMYKIPLYTHTHFKIRQWELAKSMLHTAFAAGRSPDGEAAALSALSALLPLLTAYDTSSTDSKDTRPQRAARLMEQQYARALTMEQVAAAVHLSEKYFYRCFKQCFGMPPKHYLLHVRMERAAELLQTTDLPVQEIARSVGYASPLVFSTAFRSFNGRSPTSFRLTEQRKPKPQNG